MMDIKAPRLFGVRIVLATGDEQRDGFGMLFTGSELHDELMSDSDRSHTRLQRSLDKGAGTFRHDGALCHLEPCDDERSAHAWAQRWRHVMAESRRMIERKHGQ